MPYHTKGTPEYHIIKLKKLVEWLARNPNNNPLVADEHEALEWAIPILEEHIKKEENV